MKNTNYKDRVKQLIAHKAGMEPKEILEDMFFGDDLNLGELELQEILEELEDMFTVDLVSGQGDIESVKDLFDALEEKLD
jgi:acyl carrier protein